jgi:hypothetical protein
MANPSNRTPALTAATNRLTNSLSEAIVSSLLGDFTLRCFIRFATYPAQMDAIRGVVVAAYPKIYATTKLGLLQDLGEGTAARRRQAAEQAAW